MTQAQDVTKLKSLSAYPWAQVFAGYKSSLCTGYPGAAWASPRMLAAALTCYTTTWAIQAERLTASQILGSEGESVTSGVCWGLQPLGVSIMTQAKKISNALVTTGSWLRQPELTLSAESLATFQLSSRRF